MQTLRGLAIGPATPTQAQGYVHSVFANACNIALADGGYLSLLARHLADAPAAIRLDCRDDFDALFAVDTPFVLQDGYWRTKACYGSLRDVPTWLPSWRKTDPTRITDNLALAQSAWQRWHSAQGGWEHAALFAPLCQQLAAALNQPLRLASLTQQWVGLGPGLTPSADDILVGFCAALTRLVRDDAALQPSLQALQAALCSQVTRTTAVSGHYLRLAAQAWFSEPLTQLSENLLAETPASLLAADVQRLLAIGASSGVDGLSGLLAAYQQYYATRHLDD